MRAASEPAGCDICVVGAGIVGLATARALQLRHPGASVLVLEREPGPARHQSGRSSGVIHAGIYYEPGSLKARLCVAGAAALYRYCRERGIPARRDGKLIVATDPGEIAGLDELERRGRANGVAALERIGPERLREIEPHARGVGALHSPATGIVDFTAVAEALAADVLAAGGRLRYGFEATGLSEDGAGVEIAGRGGVVVRAGRLVACAGPWADRLAVAAGADPDPRIVPFRGAYLRLRPVRDHLVRASIYPVPDPALPFLGVHLTRGPRGEVLLGPTALLAAGRDAGRRGAPSGRDIAQSLAWPGTWRLAGSHWRAALTELRHALSPRSLLAEARRYVPELRPGDLVRDHRRGVRAQAVARDGSLVDDFVISATARTLHLRNAPSPAATAALALAEEIADRVDRLG